MKHIFSRTKVHRQLHAQTDTHMTEVLAGRVVSWVGYLSLRVRDFDTNRTEDEVSVTHCNVFAATVASGNEQMMVHVYPHM